MPGVESDSNQIPQLCAGLFQARLCAGTKKGAAVICPATPSLLRIALRLDLLAHLLTHLLAKFVHLLLELLHLLPQLIHMFLVDLVA